MNNNRIQNKNQTTLLLLKKKTSEISNRFECVCVSVHIQPIRTVTNVTKPALVSNVAKCSGRETISDTTYIWSNFLTKQNQALEIF